MRKRLIAALVDNVREIQTVIGVGLLAYGAHQVYPPAGYLIPGLVLVWLGLPSRPSPILPSPKEHA